jgi:hypothetical protein
MTNLVPKPHSYKNMAYNIHKHLSNGGQQFINDHASEQNTLRESASLIFKCTNKVNCQIFVVEHNNEKFIR